MCRRMESLFSNGSPQKQQEKSSLPPEKETSQLFNLNQSLMHIIAISIHNY